MSYKIAYYTALENGIIILSRAAQKLRDNYGPAFQICARSPADFINKKKLEQFISEIASFQLVIMHLHGGKGSLPGFDRLVSALEKSGAPLYIHATSLEDEVESRQHSNLSEKDYRYARKYINCSGMDNLYNLFLWAANRFAGGSFTVCEPVPPPWEGIYHPRFPDGSIQWPVYRAQCCPAGRPTIGILFYRSHWLAENTAYIDALVEAVEKQGANALPIFLQATRDVELGNQGIEGVVDNMLLVDGRPVVDVLINTLLFSQSLKHGPELEPGENNCFTRLGVPVLQGIVSLNSYREWFDSLQGLNPMDIAISIAMPEFDGNLITVPAATREYGVRDSLTGAQMIYYHPVPERVNKIAGLTLKWARLRQKPNREKKVAVIFHNYPPRNDTIGSAFGLDSPASVLNILHEMKEAGYTLSSLPENSQALMEDILSRVTNDRRWASAEQMAESAVDGVTPEEYAGWHQEFPEKVKMQLANDWGAPPGEVFNYGGKLLIPGIINGNVFIGMQPPRGFLDDPSKIYHSPDTSPPYHYLAYYRWLRDDFGADAVMHIGKHGSLEWLPGKSAGLGDSCYPDLSIADLPNIYPYIINNPGEGTQAKRRSYCCIIDHLIPVMTNADTYDELAGLEVQLEDYYQAKMLDPGKLPHLQRLIWEKVTAAHLDRDLDCRWEEVSRDFYVFLENLHGYISEIKDTQIRDGLHILGRPPQAEKLVEMLIALTRLPNGPVPSLRQEIAAALDLDYDTLLAERGKFISGRGKTGGQLLDEINALIKQIITALYEEGFNPEAVPQICRQFLWNSVPPVEKTLHYIATVLVDKLGGTAGELTHAMDALAGLFVPPGPSGAPTRGMADILPTGRNFYSIDPRAIPSPAAWEVGVALGDALLERYLADEGMYPESIGIIIWGSPTMRTKGDDIAEILYLMGVKPVWEEKSGRVNDLSVIPSSELGRPRIDVTVRISGFFRDAFPNVVTLLDEAVEMVADLPAEEEKNYLAEHVREETEALAAGGTAAAKAKEMALYRIFGCRPGAYGAGVSNAIDAKNWQDEHDLGNIYVTWGGYAYGGKKYGVTAPEQFKKRLSRLDLTVKNEDAREYDMLDSDDFYSFHGGMIAAVKAFKGALPHSYSGDSSDPARVKMRSVAEETKHIFRSRILNPKWIESMQRHGYKGAGDLSRTVDFVFGWDATAEVMEDWMYGELAKKYALDPGMQDWMKKVNPWALQNIAERLLEAVERKMWDAAPEMVDQLKEIYLDIEGEIEGRTE